MLNLTTLKTGVLSDVAELGPPTLTSHPVHLLWSWGRLSLVSALLPPAN